MIFGANIQVYCPDYGIVKDGIISYYPLYDKFLHPPASTMHLLCLPLYYPTGTVQATCQNDGTWDNVLGSCKPIIPTSSNTSCTAHTNINNRSITYFGIPINSTYPQGTMAFVNCANISHHISGSHSAVCIEGKWSTKLGKCIPSQA
ncbi:unnamed protein product [Dracunculus medinensis]|uniref:Sushi domain-containing protein n=1 Tax=Dracunculus medinensis TaxID=318479 RepID=A0A158Q4U5_DRAME|nr:unnamed protein product [Dracunculus medinensis]